MQFQEWAHSNGYKGILRIDLERQPAKDLTCDAGVISYFHDGEWGYYGLYRFQFGHRDRPDTFWNTRWEQPFNQAKFSSEGLDAIQTWPEDWCKNELVICRERSAQDRSGGTPSEWQRHDRYHLYSTRFAATLEGMVRSMGADVKDPYQRDLDRQAIYSLNRLIEGAYTQTLKMFGDLVRHMNFE